MANDRKDSKFVDKDSNSLSSSIEGFSKSMTKNSSELKLNTKSLSQNSTSLDKNTVALMSMVSAFGKSVNQMEDTLEDFTRSQAEDTERRRKNQESETERQSAVSKKTEESTSRVFSKGEALVESFKVVGSRLVKEYLGGAQRIMDSYKKSFGDITVRMQWSESDYASMFNSVRDTIMRDGYGQQFSTKDYTTALTEALSTGLRGDEAREIAYQNMVTNKLLPAISTNTAAYRRMSKDFGKTFSEGITAVGKYSERLYGAEGLEEGKANQIIETLQATLKLQGQRSGLSDEQILSSQNGLIFGLNALESLGVNSDHFVSTMGKILEGTIDDSTLSFASAGLTSDTLANRLFEDPLSVIQSYIDLVGQGSGQISQQGQNYISEALGVDARTGLQVLAAKEKGIDWDQIRGDWSDFDVNQEISSQKSWLKSGGGKTADERLDTYEENIATSIGVIGAQIPRLTEIKEDLKKIKDILIGSSLLGGSGVGKNLLGSLLDKGKGLVSNSGLLNKASSILEDGNIAGEWLREGYSFKDVASATGQGKALLGKISNIGGTGSTLGGFASLASGVAGGVMAAKDAWNAGKVAAENGGDTLDVVGQGLRGAITGRTEKTSEEFSSAVDKALSGEKQKMDWGAVGANAAKGALLGTAVNAGAGTLIGAATGAVTSMIDQAIENAKYNNLAESVTEFNDSLTAASTSMSSYENVLKKSETVYSNLDKVTGKVTASEQDKLSALKSLKEQYPALLANVDNLSDFDSDYVEIIKNKIEREKELAASNAVTNLVDLVDKAKEASEDTNKIVSGENSITKQGMDFISDVTNAAKKAGMGDDVEGWAQTHEGEVMKFAETRAKEAGMSTDAFIGKINQAKNGGFFQLENVTNDAGVVVGTRWVPSTGTWGDNYLQASESYNESGVLVGKEDALSKAVEKDYSRILELAGQFDEIYANTNKNGKINLTENQIKQIASSSDSLKPLMDSYNNNVLLAEGTTKSQIHSDNEMWSSAKKLFDAADEKFPKFKLGAYDIQNDQLAQLHTGEMVLTSANADKLRQIGSGGISGVLDKMSAMSDEVTTSTVQSDTSHQDSLFTTVVSAIESQTAELVKYLVEINSSIMRIVSQNGFAGSTEITAATVTYEGR